jgi:hypothetical protein
MGPHFKMLVATRAMQLATTLETAPCAVPYTRSYSKFVSRIKCYRIREGLEMTSVDVMFKYQYAPTEGVMRAMDYVREVYGIRRIRFNEADRTIRVEYDATRMNQDTVAALLRRTGLELGDKLQLV